MSRNPYESPYSGDGTSRSTGSEDLTGVDWLVAILCSGIGCIVGIVRIIQGKPSGGKMLAISLAFMFLWLIVRVALMSAQQGGQ